MLNVKVFSLSGARASFELKELGLVHTMPDKFENATLLLRLGLPSTLQRTYPHKKIRENGTF